MFKTKLSGIRIPSYKNTKNERAKKIAPVKHVYIPTKQHIGKAAIPVAKTGDRVLRGQLIAEADGDFSSPIYSSVSGTILKIEKSISAASHRDENGNYIDRQIDIDLIAVDDIVVDSPTLQLPHPRMHLRDFVLTPMMHLNPHWVHPILNQSIIHLHNQLYEKDN